MKPEIGKIYPWKEVKNNWFGEQTFLSKRRGRIVCATLDLEKNPFAPQVMVVGTKPRNMQRAEEFCLQRNAIPLFLKVRPNQWMYEGFWGINRWTTQRDELTDAEKKYGGPLTRVIFLEKADEDSSYEEWLNPNSRALFINGIYAGVLEEIICAQKNHGVDTCYIQPYSGQILQVLKRDPPSPVDPIRLYLSTTGNLNQICYTGSIIGWEDKRALSEERRNEVLEHLLEYQSGEVALFTGEEDQGKTAINLISVRDCRKLETLNSTSILRKVSNDLPLGKRSRAGGWSEVYDIGDLIDLPSETQEQLEADLSREVARSNSDTDAERHERLRSAPRIPERIQVISSGFRRNADVIVSVLRRAQGICEKCRQPAPFLRRTDGTPFLEVHHWIPLSQGGEDTVENAAALCPNCHREVHHG